MSGLTAPLQAWMAGGCFVRLDEVDLFYRTSGMGNMDLPWLVCFHGFPTSSWDWHLLLPYLEKTHRVLVFDFPGYGLSGKPVNRDYSLKRQLDAAEVLLNFLRIRDFDLLAHDMGNSVACELLRRREAGAYSFTLKSLTLLNGGIYMNLHQPLLTQRRTQHPVQNCELHAGADTHGRAMDRPLASTGVAIQSHLGKTGPNRDLRYSPRTLRSEHGHQPDDTGQHWSLSAARGSGEGC